MTIALLADGFAFFMWTEESVFWLATVAIAGALAALWLLRSTPASVLAVITAAVGVLHLVGAGWSAL